MLANLIRKAYDTYTLPLGKLCVKLGLSPDFLTLVSLLISILAGALLSQGWFGWGLILVLLTNVSDMLDGATARAEGAQLIPSAGFWITFPIAMLSSSF